MSGTDTSTLLQPTDCHQHPLTARIAEQSLIKPHYNRDGMRSNQSPQRYAKVGVKLIYTSNV